VDEFGDGLIEMIRDSICPKYGVQPLEYRIVVRGWCRKCMAGNKQKNPETAGV
jgi:hypothetical protein